MLTAGLVGLPNAGKSTLFEALTRAGALIAPYPFSTVEPNVGVVRVPTRWLWALAECVGAESVVPPLIEVRDIAGLVRGAHRGEGLGNRFLAHIREVDIILHVLRAFDVPQVAHPHGNIDPWRDREVVELELTMKDLETVEGRLQSLRKRAKSALALRPLIEQMEALHRHLATGQSARTFRYGDEQLKRELTSLSLLTLKPMIYVLNTDFVDFSSQQVEALAREACHRLGTAAFVILNAELECELAQMPENEQKAFLAEMHLDRPGVLWLLELILTQLDLMVVYTVAGGREARAWIVRRGVTAIEFAGKVHSDFARHFVRAEVVSAEQFVAVGSEAECRARGIVRSVGRDEPLPPESVVKIIHTA